MLKGGGAKRQWDWRTRSAACLSKQGDSQLKKRRLTGKYGNSLRSDIRISIPSSWPCRPCGPLRSQKFCHRRWTRTLAVSYSRRYASLSCLVRGILVETKRVSPQKKTAYREIRELATFISSPSSWLRRPCGPLRSQKFCHRRRARTLGCQLARKVASLVKAMSKTYSGINCKKQ